MSRKITYNIRWIGKLCCLLILIILILPAFEFVVNQWLCPYMEKIFRFKGPFKYVFDVIYCLSMSYLSFLTASYIKRSHITFSDIVHTITLLFVVLFLWVYYRFIYLSWLYYMVFNTQIAYVDIILFSYFIICCYSIICFIRENKTCEMNITERLIIDEPIRELEEDILNRSKFANNLASRIMSLKTDSGARSIAIVSPWGDGKTSFINLVCNHFRENSNYLVIRFSPWYLNPETSITNKFYKQVIDEIASINYNTSNKIKKYASLLEDTKLSMVSKFIRNTKPSIKEIGKRLTSLGLKVLIIIDDFDRLNADEIEEIFRLIRGSANIPNFIFLSAFDKKYINDTLSKSAKAVTEHYVEKFFELEFNLPDYDKGILEDRIMTISKGFLLTEDIEPFNKYIAETSLFNQTKPYEVLGNLRGIYRWMNNIQIKYDILKGECKITDLADLELLNLLYPDVYELLRKEYNRFLINQYGVYHLWSKSNNNYNSQYRDLFNKPKDIRDEPQVKNMPSREREALDLILNRLFSGSYTQEPKAISNPNYTERYFYQILQSSELSGKDFDELINGPFEDIKKFIIEDKEETFSQSLRLKCFEDNTQDKDRARKILHLIFYAAKTYKHFGFAPQYIDKHLNTATTTQNEKKELLNVLVYENGFSLFVVYLFTFNNFYNGRYCWDKLLTNSEMDAYLEDMFRFATQSNFNFGDILNIYYLTLRKENRTDDAGNTQEIDVAIAEISDILRRYIAEHIIECLPFLIYQHPYETNGKFKLLNIVSDLWNNWDSFLQYAKDNNIPLKMNDSVKEFGDFWCKYEDKREPIDYEFSHINRSH